MARAFDNGHTYADSKADAVSKATAVLKSWAGKCRGAKTTITDTPRGLTLQAISRRRPETIKGRSMRTRSSVWR